MSKKEAKQEAKPVKMYRLEKVGMLYRVVTAVVENGKVISEERTVETLQASALSELEEKILDDVLESIGEV